MQWTEMVKLQIDALQPIKMSAEVAQRIISLMDLTSLNATDTQESIALFLEKANTPVGPVAAVCVYPQFVRMAATEFISSPVKVATVANFPQGDHSLEEVLIEIGKAIEDKAQEIDVVFPYHRYLAGERQYIETFISACKAACGDQVLLKVILETGMLGDLTIIADASFDVLKAGADFIKTSTGKIAEGATLEAVAAMLLVVKHIEPKLHRRVGVKVAGGVKSVAEAAQFIELADNILGREEVTADTFRIGASKLLDECLESFR